MTLEEGDREPQAQQPDPRLVLREVTDARTMRALSHPVRIALVEELWAGGALTATELGERIGETPTTCSFHLRQLAKYGWVEEAGGGKGRARPWRMTSLGFQIPGVQEDPESIVATNVLTGMFRERQLARYGAWRQARYSWPLEWREATTDSQYYFYLTVEELSGLSKDLHAVLGKWFSPERITDPSRRPPGSVPVELLALSYPVDVPPDSDESGAESTAPGAGDPGQDDGTPGAPR